jgi:putative peptide zinc metalloprotease protein
MLGTATSTPGSDQLPPIREDLKFVGPSRDPRGEAVWLVHDPLRNLYLELRPLAYAILSRWTIGSARGLIDSLVRETPYQIKAADLTEFAGFLKENQLLRRLSSPPQAAPPSQVARFQKSVMGLLFFRLRVLRSDRPLQMLLPWTELFYSRAFWILTILLGVAGLGLVYRQWDQFSRTFTGFMNLQGLAVILAAIVLSKIIHELGHGLTARRLGCNVPAMGVAFILGMPLAYTEVTDVWRLVRKRDRLKVSAGGIMAETALAAIATWGWLILPEGPARSACFVIATTSWITTLIVNLNPFMRFDGYYMLSDLLGIRNLQTRSFNMGKWALRRLLFGWPAALPESGSRRLLVFLAAFAWCTWFVRFTVFAGIAIFAYFLFGKTFGSFIAVMEVWILIATPVYKEVKTWFGGRKVWVGQPRAWLTMLLTGLLLVWFLVPQSYRLSLPAVLVPADRLWVHAPRASIVLRLPLADSLVEKDQIILQLQDPDLEHRIAQSNRRLNMIDLALRQTGSSQKAARKRAVIKQEKAQEQAALNGLREQQSSLTIRAPFAGRVTEVDADIKPGHWVDPDLPQFLLVRSGPNRLVAYVDDRDRRLVALPGWARFYPEVPDYPVLNGTVLKIENVPAEFLDEPLLAAQNGGDIATRKDRQNQLVPENGLYRVAVKLSQDTGTKINQVLRGTLQCTSKPYAPAQLLFDRVRGLLNRELG